MLLTALGVWAQTLPPSNLFSSGTGVARPNSLPPLTAPHIPQSNGDHATTRDLYLRQQETILRNATDIPSAIATLARFNGSQPIYPTPGTPGAQEYQVAFQLIPPVTLQNGSVRHWNSYRIFNPRPQGGFAAGGRFVAGPPTSQPPALFQPSGTTTPTTPPTVAPPAPRPPVKVSVHTWAQMSTGGGRTQTVVMRMIGNFRGITTAPSARRTSRTVTTQATQQPSRPSFSRGILFRGHGSFTLHIRSLRSLSAQRMSLRAGR